jgi:predicted pyridoxine 5'-phosphate oxidase superfamily flavin-nucleotide-binding protein
MDEEMNILAQSDEAAALFGEVQHFLEIIDEDSQNKARKRLGQKKKIKTELVMQS